MRLNSEQALTPMESDLGLTVLRNPEDIMQLELTASFCSYIKDDCVHVFKYFGCPSLHTSRKK